MISSSTSSSNHLTGRRREDAALLQGRGRYCSDIRLPGQAAAVFVRSPFASARILSLDAAEAAAAPGVLAVLTASDMAAAGLGNVSRPVPVPGRGGSGLIVPERPALAGAQVRHVGEAVALVVAETLAAAQDAAELVMVDYEELPAVADLAAAAEAGAAQVWPQAPGNLAVDWPGPPDPEGANARRVDQAFAGAAHVVRLRLVNQRVVVASLEPRAAVACWDAAADRYTLHCGSQGVAAMQDQLAGILGVPSERMEVFTPDVGGAFGMKTPPYPEYAALLVAARTVGRPVGWTSSRSEAFVSDNQGRDTITEAALALDGEGRFLALKVEALANMGAYLSSHGPFIASVNFGRCFPTVYAIGAVAVRVRCLFTHTVPTGPYRGAGRPEANYVMERLVDEAARVLGIDRVALRRRNLIRPETLPWHSPTGPVYDSGAFTEVLDQAMAAADLAGFSARRDASLRAGKRRGFGVSCFLEHSGGAPREPADLSFPGDGRLHVGLDVQASGQGHATVFARLAAGLLGVAEDHVVVGEGDSRRGLQGNASVASRSTMTAGSAIHGAVAQVIAKGRAVAARALGVAEGEVSYANGVFTAAPTNRWLPLFEVAALAAGMKADGQLAESLDTRFTAEVPPSFPNGCHIAEVEIDPETGVVVICRYTAVDDSGVLLDPVLVTGQIQGGVVQGVGQALLEHAIYDDGGQLLTGSFMDYGLPRADLLPAIETRAAATPCRTNPLGVKGAGEAGTTAALAAVMNAIADALPGGAFIDMPATPEKVWRACHAARPHG